MNGITLTRGIAIYDVKLAFVSKLDRAGEDCPVCDNETATIEAQLYWMEHGEVQFQECCGACMKIIVEDAAPISQSAITVELLRDYA